MEQLIRRQDFCDLIGSLLSSSVVGAITTARPDSARHHSFMRHNDPDSSPAGAEPL